MARFPTKLECPTVEITPGEPLRCRLRIYNPADAVDEYTVVGLDEAADWVSTDPPSLALLPEADGELQLIVTIASDALVPAGRHHIVVAIHPSLEQMSAQTEDLVVDVAEVSDLDLSVSTPPPASADDDVTATLAVSNRGNHPLALGFSATDHDHDLPVRVDPWEVVLEPFHVHGIRLTLPLGSCRARGSHTHRVEVTATADSGLTRSARAVVTHEPGPRPSRSLGEWLRDTARLFVVVPILAVVLVALEVLAAIALVLRFEWSAIAVAVATSLAGAALVAYYRGALHKVRAARAEANQVDDRLAEESVWQLTGILLLIPGFLTDLAGAVLLVPGVRRAARAKLLGALASGDQA